MKRKLQAGERAITSMPIEVKAIDKQNFRLTMVASTQDVDRHGDTVMQAGWDLGPFSKNPVILNSHNYYDATEVIARAENTRIEGKGKKAKLVQEWVFAVNENPKAKIIFDLYAGKFLHASSVGFIPRKFAENPDGSKNWYVIEEAELLEVSAVSVPANGAALLAKSIGVDLKQLEEAVHIEPEAEDEDDEESDEDTPPVTAETTPESVVTPETTEDTPPAPETTPEETVEQKRARLETERERIEAELKTITPDSPAPVVTPAKKSYSAKVLKALNSIEDEQTRALKAAHIVIGKMLRGEVAENLSPDTQKKVRDRQYNQVIRNLIKAR